MFEWWRRRLEKRRELEAKERKMAIALERLENSDREECDVDSIEKEIEASAADIVAILESEMNQS